MGYNYITGIFQFTAGIALLASTMALVIALVGTHPDQKRSEVVPLVGLSIFNEVALAFSVLFVFTSTPSSVISLLLTALLLVTTISQVVIRFYHLNVLRSLFQKEGKDDGSTR